MKQPESSTPAPKRLSRTLVFSWIKAHRRILVTVLLVLTALVLVSIFSKSGIIRGLPSKEYSSAYSLVSEKISKSAAILLTLPKGLHKAEAAAAVTFDPPIRGGWISVDSPRQIAFQPKGELKVGMHYAVKLASVELEMRADFLVDEDPKIETVLPKPGSEADEHSSITFIFNRPMVPLTTLSELEKKEVPIVITPETEGKFKWISTRNLQFIPKNGLIRSSHYVVSIKDGLTSLDGLSVKPQEVKFITRPLRYESIANGTILHDAPVTISFNQPVDDKKTSPFITVRKAGGSAVPIEIRYGIRSVYNPKTKKIEELIDRSILNIFQKTDSHGREGFWDFNSSYVLSIAKAVPEKGDIILIEPRSSTFTVPTIIESVHAVSDRSTWVRPDLFDPTGTLVVTFYEDIDKDKTDIKTKNLAGVAYGEKCKVDASGEIVYSSGGDCLKEADKRVLIFSFDSKKFSTSEAFNIALTHVYNTDGVEINPEPLILPVITYPSFTLLKTIPQNADKNASLEELVLCSNTPIKSQSVEDYKTALSSDNRLVFGRWENSFLVSPQSVQYSKCAVNQFETHIRYGLLPETPYSLSLKLTDEFGQTFSRALSFTTKKAEGIYYRLHSLQKVYNVTTPDKTKLTFAAENLEDVRMTICKVTPQNLLSVLSNQPSRTQAEEGVVCQSIRTDTITLPKRYWVNNYFQVNLADYFPAVTGHYIVTLTHPLYREEYAGPDGLKNQLYERTYVSVTTLGVAEKRVKWEEPYNNYYREESTRVSDKALSEPGQNLYWVTRLKTLEPISGATVSLYTQNAKGENLAFSKSVATNVEGIAQTEVIKNVRGVVVTSGSESAIVSDWTDNVQWSQMAAESGKTYIYTDRPIYRPGQDVFVRGIDRIGYDGSYKIWNESKAPLKVFDSRGTEIYSQALSLSDYGTFNTQFKLPPTASLGTYRIEIFGQSGYFDVEEYVGAAFKFDATSDKEEYISGETMKLNLDANYYFGVPVSKGKVQYSVTSQDYYFDRYSDEYFNFGKRWYSCYRCGYGDQFLFRDSTVLDENGKAKIEHSLDFKTLYKKPNDEGSKIFVVHMTVTDENGKSVSTQKSFIVHRGELYLGVKTDNYFIGKNENFTLRAKSVDTKGLPIPKGSISLVINKITWNVFKRREVDGGFYYSSEKQKTQVKKTSFSTDRKGNWDDTFSLDQEGEYEITLSTTDSLGNTIEGATNLYVYGEGTVSIEPQNNATLEIEADRLNVKDGDTVHFIVKSPYKKAKALITVDRGKVFDYKIANVDRNLFDFYLPIRKEYAPNIFASVLLLSNDPEIKFGQVALSVDAEEHELNVEVTSDKKQYLPGEKVSLAVKTTDYLGKPVPAEVSVAVADLSVLALKGNPKKNPFIFFYDGFPLTVTTASNLKNILYEVPIPTGGKGGGGGNDPEDLAKRARGDFRDTAFWKANVVTDATGTATVTFTLPDNLTTWQVESLAVTKDTKLGVNYQEIKARKDIMLVPIRPRFIVPGDSFFIGGTVFNQTNETQRLSLSLRDITLSIEGNSNAALTLSPGESKTIYFKVKAPETLDRGFHSFTLSAKNEAFEDTVVSSIRITPNDTYEASATANASKQNSAKEYIYIPEGIVKDKGEVTVNTNATMAVYLSGALRSLLSIPYASGEQMASKLEAIAIVKKGLNIKNVGESFDLKTVEFEGKPLSLDEAVTKSLNRLYENQNADGGFTYYKNMPSSFYLTLHVIEALKQLRGAGYSVSDYSLSRGADYLATQINTSPSYAQDKDLAILTAYTLSGLEVSGRSALLNRVSGYIYDKKFLNENSSSLTLGYLALLSISEFGSSERSRVFDVLENRVAVDGRGAYLKNSDNRFYYDYYETSVRDTALLLKAMTLRGEESPLFEKVLRWLLLSRSKDGGWGSSVNTLSVVDAMTDYLKLNRETESDFKLAVSLDEKKVFNFDFNPKTILKTMTGFLPVGTIEPEKVHTVTFTRTNRNELQNNFYYDLILRYFLPIEKVPPRDEGITIIRNIYAVSDTDKTTPVFEAKLGEVLRGTLTVLTPKNYHYVAIEDFIPAGFELVNTNLETEDKTVSTPQNGPGYELGYGDSLPVPSLPSQKSKKGFSLFDSLFGQDKTPPGPETYADLQKPISTKFYPDFIESHDDRLYLFKENMPEGVYEYEYFIRAQVPGTYLHLPAVASELYFPEIFGRTEGGYFKVLE